MPDAKVRTKSPVKARPALTPSKAARVAGLRYVSDEEPGIVRRKRGKGFCYVSAGGERVTDTETLARIRSLAIPPAYRDVWICSDPDGHIQATGRDARGRKQYRYHPRFRALRDSTKFDRILEFAASLPAIRCRIDEDMKRRGLPREKVLATIVHLLETTMIRVGNADYARQNKSFGLTTLRGRHVAVEGSEIRFQFKGKSGKQWRLKVRDRRIARIVRQIQDLPGQNLFQYLDEDGERHTITSGDVNAYLKDVSGQDITAKDFRTWSGTVLAAMALAELGEAQNATEAQRNVRQAVEGVARSLGNTPTICRKCYIHPAIITSYLDGDLGIAAITPAEAGGQGGAGDLPAAEGVVLDFLRGRLQAAFRKS